MDGVIQMLQRQLGWAKSSIDNCRKEIEEHQGHIARLDLEIARISVQVLEYEKALDVLKEGNK